MLFIDTVLTIYSEYNYSNHLYVQKTGNENDDTGYSKFYNIRITVLSFTVPFQ